MLSCLGVYGMWFFLLIPELKLVFWLRNKIAFPIFADCIEMLNTFLDVFDHCLLIIWVNLVLQTGGTLMNFWCKDLGLKLVNRCSFKGANWLLLWWSPSDFNGASAVVRTNFQTTCLPCTITLWDNKVRDTFIPFKVSKNVCCMHLFFPFYKLVNESK